MSFREKGDKNRGGKDFDGNTFPKALPAYSVDSVDDARKLITFVGYRRWRPREGEVGITFGLTDWPRNAEYDDLAGAQAFLHAAAARLLGHDKPDYVESDLPDWSRDPIRRFGPGD